MFGPLRTGMNFSQRADGVWSSEICPAESFALVNRMRCAEMGAGKHREWRWSEEFNARIQRVLCRQIYVSFHIFPLWHICLSSSPSWNLNLEPEFLEILDPTFLTVPFHALVPPFHLGLGTELRAPCNRGSGSWPPKRRLAIHPASGL